MTQTKNLWDKMCIIESMTTEQNEDGRSNTTKTKVCTAAGISPLPSPLHEKSTFEMPFQVSSSVQSNADLNEEQ